MKRVYVIMREMEDSFGTVTEPYDVVSSMDDAERICYEMEATANKEKQPFVYYWREVISSEE